MIIDGKAIADEIQNDLRYELQQLALKGARKPRLAVILVGDHSPSRIYVTRKTKACHDVGIDSSTKELPESVSESSLLQEIHQLNNDPNVDGILVQLPLPHHINTLNVIKSISPSKDVDGLHPLNVGGVLLGIESAFAPCTPLGVKVLLEKSEISVYGKHVVVLGRSNLVGKPMAALLMQNIPTANATVTVVHSKTERIKEIVHTADVIIAAIGKPRFVTADMVKDGAVIIDVGINRIDNNEKKSGYELVGDVDFEGVKDKCSAITPVPGGVGPMTIAMLLSNTLKSYFSQK
jgi:methylenetetrahydrofolate dehydrogenase (NADP+)/methenyltetrahydrofolate cyclohydrolase